MKLTPKKTFLLRQLSVDGGKVQDVIARKGVPIEVTEKEAAQFFGCFELKEAEEKKIVAANKGKSVRIV